MASKWNLKNSSFKRLSETMTAVKSSLLSFDITEVFYQIEGTGFMIEFLYALVHISQCENP